jgi:hypothetical protein
MTDDPIAAIDHELRRIEEAAIYSSQSQFVQAKIWRAVNLGLGAPASILAAVSAGTGLANAGARTLAAVLALIAAGLGAVMTTLNSNRRAEQAHMSANAYLKLQNDARIARTIDLPGMDLPKARALLNDLDGRRDEINRSAEIPFAVAYWLGKRNIERGGTTFEVDK